MIWKLISYSEIKIPLAPFTSDYIIGIVENESNERKIVNIKNEHIHIDQIGRIEKRNCPTGDLNVFIPIIK